MRATKNELTSCISILILCLSLTGILFSAGRLSSIVVSSGNLDPTFSGDGKLIDGVRFGAEYGRHAALQADGKLIVTGSRWNGNEQYDFSIVRYNRDGSLDASFGMGGRVTTLIRRGYSDGASSVAIQADGKIVVAGNSSTEPTLVRYLHDGSLDASFGESGKVIGEEAMNVAAVVIQSDGKIVAAGTAGAFPDSFVIARYNSDGSVDTTFSGGRVRTPIGVGTSCHAVAVQPDGKIVAGGNSITLEMGLDFTLVRYNANGTLDTTFGGDGIVPMSMSSSHDIIHALVLQADAKIVAAGFAYNGSNNDFALARFNSDGSLDSSFGSSGKVITPIGTQWEAAYSVALHPNGKIVAAGFAGLGSAAHFALVRYNPDGSPDTTFDSDGKVTTRVGTGDATAFGVVLRPDGTAICAGNAFNGNRGDDFAVAQYAPNGKLDPTFDGDGRALTDFGRFYENYLNSVAIQVDGKMLVGGTSLVRYHPDGTRDMSFGTESVVDDRISGMLIQPDGKIATNSFAGFRRYNPNGSPDVTFGGTGTVPILIEHRSIALQSDGKLVAAGGLCTASDPDGKCLMQEIAAVRFNSDGSNDTSFGSGGRVTTSVGTYSFATSIVIQPNGKLLIGGITSSPSEQDFTLVRYNPDGSLDTSFSDDGIVVTSVGPFGDYLRSITLKPDGTIYAAGEHFNGTDGDFFVASYLSNGALNTEFDGDGIAITSIGSGFDYAHSIAIQSDGKIVVGGTSESDSEYDFAIARYNPDGSLDSTLGGGDGKATADFDSSRDEAAGMALDAKGRAVLVGWSEGAFAIARFSLARISPFDFDGDGRSDVSTFRPVNSIWYLDRSTDGFSAIQFGVATDKLVPADYDGDGKTDVSVFRDGVWWRINSSDATIAAVPFGITGDVPVPADFTGDGRDELAVFRSGQWWTLDLATGHSNLVQYGLGGDKPVVADYDGDGRADQAVYRSGEWRINRSSLGPAVISFGLSSDRPVAGDYDGDGRADPAVFRDGVWYLLRSTQGFTAFQFGLPNDVPAPGDYDGDGKIDAAVYREGIWYMNRSSGAVLIQQFGLAGDRPIPSSYVP